MAAPEENREHTIAWDDEGRPAKLRFTSFGSAEESLRAGRELAEEERLEAAREAGIDLSPTASSNSKKKPGRKRDNGDKAKGQGQGNHSNDNPPPWTDAESLELLKLVRDGGTESFASIATKLNEVFWKDSEFAGRTINGCRPQYTKLMGGNRTATIDNVPAKIKELEDKLGK